MGFIFGNSEDCEGFFAEIKMTQTEDVVSAIASGDLIIDRYSLVFYVLPDTRIVFTEKSIAPMDKLGSLGKEPQYKFLGGYPVETKVGYDIDVLPSIYSFFTRQILEKMNPSYYVSEISASGDEPSVKINEGITQLQLDECARRAEEFAASCINHIKSSHKSAELYYDAVEKNTFFALIKWRID